MKKFIVVLIIVFSLIPSTILSKGNRTKSNKSSENNEMCSRIANMCERCYDGNLTIAEIQDMGISRGVDSEVVMLLGELCRVSIEAKSKGWSKSFTHKYAFDKCHQVFR